LTITVSEISAALRRARNVTREGSKIMKSGIPKLRAVLASAVALCALTALNCFNDPLTPVAPTWDVNLTVPMANRTITLQEIVDKDPTLLQAGTGNQLVYSSSSAATPATVGDKVSMVPANTAGSVKLGSFGVTAGPYVNPMTIPGLPGGTFGPITSQQFHLADVNNAVSSSISAKLSGGRIRLTIQNNMTIPIRVDSTIILSDGATAQARFTFSGTIAANSSGFAEDNLAGRTIVTGESLIGFYFSTTGSGGGNVMVPATPFQTTLSLSGLAATEATITSLPAQRLTDNDNSALSLHDSTHVVSATIRSGRLDFTFTSRLPFGVRFRFRINELKRTVGGNSVSYEDSVTIAALGTTPYSLNLGGCSLASVTPGALLDSVRLTSSIVIPSVVNGPLTVHDTDRVAIAMHDGLPIVADTAMAVLKPTWVDVNTTVPLNFGKSSSKLSAQINLAAASLNFALNSSIGFPADLYLRVSARKPGGDSAVLVLPANQRRLLPGAGVVSFNDAEVGAFLSQLSASLPDSARITGKVLINPPDAYSPTPAGAGRIGRNSAVSGTMNVRVPLTLGIASGSYIDTLAWGDGNGDGNKENNINKDDLKKVNYGNFYAEVENRLPVAVSVKLNLQDITHSTLLSIPQNGSSVAVSSGAVDGAGNVTLAAHTSVVIQLSNADVQQFIPTEFVRFVIALNTAGGGGIVSLHTTDSIRLRFWSNMSFKVAK
jgi:hypothetical protein